MPATYEAIATTTLSTTSDSIIFSSISSSYTDLKLIVVGRFDDLGTARTLDLQFNSDTATNYSNTRLNSDGTSAVSNRTTDYTYAFVGALPSQGATTGALGFVDIDIMRYAGSTYKTILSSSSNDRNGSGIVDRFTALWRSTSAINSIKIYTSAGAYNFLAGTKATLYGIKGA